MYTIRSTASLCILGKTWHKNFMHEKLMNIKFQWNKENILYIDCTLQIQWIDSNNTHMRNIFRLRILWQYFMFIHYDKNELFISWIQQWFNENIIIHVNPKHTQEAPKWNQEYNECHTIFICIHRKGSWYFDWSKIRRHKITDILILQFE